MVVHRRNPRGLVRLNGLHSQVELTILADKHHSASILYAHGTSRIGKVPTVAPSGGWYTAAASYKRPGQGDLEREPGLPFVNHGEGRGCSRDFIPCICIHAVTSCVPYWAPLSPRQFLFLPIVTEKPASDPLWGLNCAIKFKRGIIY